MNQQEKLATLRLSPSDKKVIDSFLKKIPAESKKLHTDGKTLDLLTMGGNNIASWKSGGVFIGKGRPAGRSDQTIIRELIRRGGDIVKYRPTLKFRDESQGAHHGQVDMKLSAIDNSTGETLGYVEYVLYNDEAYISHILVKKEYRRLGIAEAMMKYLYREYGKKSVNWGMTTPEGTLLKKKIDIRYGHKKLARKLLRLAKICLKTLSD